MGHQLPPGYFNTDRFGRPTFGLGPGASGPTSGEQLGTESLGIKTNYVDGGDSLAQNADMVISFLHEPSQTPVFFKAFITAFNETYSSDWVSEVVFGRTDPIHLFKQTSRRITLSFKIPAATYSEAYENLGNVQTLIQFLYPNYTSVGNGPAQTLAQNPYIRLKVMNLARQAPLATAALALGTVSRTTPVASFSPLGEAGPLKTAHYQSTSDPLQGLLGVITNLTVNHNLENAEAGVLQHSPNTILPKLIEVNLDFNVVHEHRNGWSGTTFDEPTFPYGVLTGYRKLSVGQYTYDDLGAKTFNEKIIENRKAAQEKAMAEQDRANAEARYRGLFVKARFNKDKKFMGAYKERQEYLSKGIAIDASDKEKRTYNREARKQGRSAANYDYLSSTTRGADQDGDGSIDSGFIE